MIGVTVTSRHRLGHKISDSCRRADPARAGAQTQQIRRGKSTYPSRSWGACPTDHSLTVVSANSLRLLAAACMIFPSGEPVRLLPPPNGSRYPAPYRVGFSRAQGLRCASLLEVEVALLAHVDRDAEDRPVGERVRGVVLLADVVAAVEADAQAVAAQGELARSASASAPSATTLSST